MAVTISEYERALRAAFPSAEVPGELRAMALPISGRLLRSSTPEMLVEKLKAVLPADAALYDLDGHVLRMKGAYFSYGSDCWLLVLHSEAWLAIPEGGSFPLLTPLFMGEPQPDAKLPDMRVIGDLHPEMGCELAVNKRTHSISFSRESEDSVTIVVRPKQ